MDVGFKLAKWRRIDSFVAVYGRLPGTCEGHVDSNEPKAERKLHTNEDHESLVFRLRPARLIF